MSFYQGKTVLVTGAAGFIPSHLVDALLAQGATVIGVDNFITGTRKNISHLDQNPNFHFIEADATSDPVSYLDPNLYPLTSLSCVFHMASPASPIGYQKHPVETYMVNSYGTHVLLQYLTKNFPTARFLYTSTSESYGDPLEHPQKETYWGNVNPNGPRSMYDESKRLGETICGVHTRTFGMDTRIVRIFNTYGPRIDLADERVVSGLVSQAIKNEPLQVHGDGMQTRSLCFVSDLVAGILRFMEGENLSGETINIGNPREMTILEMAKMVIELSGSTSTIEFTSARQDDPKQRCPDITKAQQLLGWTPQVSAEEGLRRTIEFARQN